MLVPLVLSFDFHFFVKSNQSINLISCNPFKWTNGGNKWGQGGMCLRFGIIQWVTKGFDFVWIVHMYQIIRPASLSTKPTSPTQFPNKSFLNLCYKKSNRNLFCSPSFGYLITILYHARGHTWILHQNVMLQKHFISGSLYFLRTSRL